MELNIIPTDITDSNKPDKADVYENTNVLSVKATEYQMQKEDEQHYERLKFGEAHKRKIKKGVQVDETVKRLKYVIYVMVVLILVLYISLISLIIYLSVPKESVNGQWASWSSWTSCDVTCGKGTRLRTRGCTNPVPFNNGKDCIGESLQSSQCLQNNCTGNGEWASWSSWISCDVKCGKGTRLRTRECTNPVPFSNGKDCIGESLQSSQCLQNNCAVNGQWASWSSWTSCDVTCGKGTRLRIRGCTNPVPLNNGNDCIGESLQSSQCLQDNCTAIISAFSVTRPKKYILIDRRPRVTFSETIYQHGSDFNISSGIFTCSIPGVYLFSATLVKKRGTARADRIYCALYKNLSVIYIRIDQLDEGTVKRSAAVSQTIVIDLDIGDKVFLRGCNGTPDEVMEYWSSFSGVLIKHIT